MKSWAALRCRQFVLISSHGVVAPDKATRSGDEKLLLSWISVWCGQTTESHAKAHHIAVLNDFSRSLLV